MAPPLYHTSTQSSILVTSEDIPLTYMTSCTVTITSPECLLSKLSPSPKLKPSDLTNLLCVCHFSMKTLYNQLQVPTTGVTPGPHTHALAASFTHTFCLHIWLIRQPGNAHSGKAVTRTRNRSPSSPRSPLSLCARAQRWWRHLYSIYGVITGVNKVTQQLYDRSQTAGAFLSVLLSSPIGNMLSQPNSAEKPQILQEEMRNRSLSREQTDVHALLSISLLFISPFIWQGQ